MPDRSTSPPIAGSGAFPVLDMLLVKAGGVNAHPANLHRLLFDEGQLVLAFPEAGPATGAARALPAGAV